MADEGAAQRVGIGKAAAQSHLLRRLAPELQEAPRCRNARLFDPGGRRDADLAMEQPGEVART